MKELKELEKEAVNLEVDFISLRDEIIAKYGDLKKFENEIEQSVYDKVTPVITQTQDTIRNSQAAVQERMEKEYIVELAKFRETLAEFKERILILEKIVEKLKSLIWPKWHFQATYAIIFALVVLAIILLIQNYSVRSVVEEGIREILFLIENKLTVK